MILAYFLETNFCHHDFAGLADAAVRVLLGAPSAFLLVELAAFEVLPLFSL